MRPARTVWVALWVVGLLLLFADYAGAQERTAASTAPVLDLRGFHPFAASPLLLEALAAADESWRVEDGVTEGNYCPVDFRWHEGYPDFGAIVEVCILTLNRTGGLPLLAQAEATDLVGRHRALVLLCVTLKHERGHLLGYPDQGPQGSGVMTALMHEMYPPACTRFADRHVPGVHPRPSEAPQKGLGVHTLNGGCRTAACKRAARSFTRLHKQANRR